MPSNTFVGCAADHRPISFEHPTVHTMSPNSRTTHSPLGSRERDVRHVAWPVAWPSHASDGGNRSVRLADREYPGTAHSAWHGRSSLQQWPAVWIALSLRSGESAAGSLRLLAGEPHGEGGSASGVCSDSCP